MRCQHKQSDLSSARAGIAVVNQTNQALALTNASPLVMVFYLRLRWRHQPLTPARNIRNRIGDTPSNADAVYASEKVASSCLGCPHQRPETREPPPCSRRRARCMQYSASEKYIRIVVEDAYRLHLQRELYCATAPSALVGFGQSAYRIATSSRRHLGDQYARETNISAISAGQSRGPQSSGCGVPIVATSFRARNTDAICVGIESCRPDSRRRSPARAGRLPSSLILLS